MIRICRALVSVQPTSRSTSCVSALRFASGSAEVGYGRRIPQAPEDCGVARDRSIAGKPLVGLSAQPSAFLRPATSTPLGVTTHFPMVWRTACFLAFALAVSLTRSREFWLRWCISNQPPTIKSMTFGSDAGLPLILRTHPKSLWCGASIWMRERVNQDDRLAIAA